MRQREAKLEILGYALLEEERAFPGPGVELILEASLRDHLGGFDEVGPVGVDRIRREDIAASGKDRETQDGTLSSCPAWE